MGNCCGKQLSDYQRDNVLLEIQSKMNNLTLAVNNVASTCNSLETRLLFFRESTFQALQVVKTNLEKVNENVRTTHVKNRQSERLQFLDLDERSYNVPRPTLPMKDRPLPPIKRNNPPKKREHTYVSMGEADDSLTKDEHTIYPRRTDTVWKSNVKSTDRLECTKQGARPKQLYVNQPLVDVPHEGVYAKPLQELDCAQSLQELEGECAQLVYDSERARVTPYPETEHLPRSDKGVGKLTSTITLTKINNTQDDVTSSVGETTEYSLKVEKDTKHI